MKDYYRILNVRQNASDDEIKRSYRVLAKKYHPDINPGDASAAERFAEINEAHDTLSDPKKRADYDIKLKESLRPKPGPEDIIAKQRAAAQAAARQAAAQAAARQAAQASMRSGFDPAMTMAQRLAAQAAAAQAAQAQQFQAQAAAQAQQYQAQAAALEKRAFELGKEHGKADAKHEYDKEKEKLNATIRDLRTENAKLREKLDETESDRSDLEQELFNRDRELTQEKTRTTELERQVEKLRQSGTRSKPLHSTGDYDALKAALEEEREKVKRLEHENNQAELKNQAQIQLQQDKRRQMQERIDELEASVVELNEEISRLRAENEEWQQYASGEDFLSDAERRMQEWELKQKADKKLAKPTLYGTLGTLIWATDEEIAAAYTKLEKRYSSKTDDTSAEKLNKVKEAYAVLSDPQKRADYNKSIDISDERFEEERRLIEENARMEEEYRSRMETKEFWADFDELNFSAQTGDAESQNKLGEMYYYGDEIEQDLDQAVYWFKEAAKQKHAEAMYNLGVCFVNGEGVEQNKTTGLGFIRQAAKLGSAAASKYGK